MAYVVLARKYRPQSFADLIGQDHVAKTLANAIAHDRVHHAYLFCGARGLGKTTMARLLAKCLVCEKGPTFEPCNECGECVAVSEGRSVDVIEIDGASNNRVEDVRNLREQVRYLPQSARRKIYIIDEVHMLTGSAFNALLKTLEEPPEHVTFILATTEVHELPATILSRVSRFDFRKQPPSRLVAHMQSILEREGVKVDEGGLYTVARAGDGSVRDTLTLLDKVIAFASDRGQIGEEEVQMVLGVPGRIFVTGLAEAVLGRDPQATLERLAAVADAGQDLQQLALAFLRHLRDLLVIKLCQTRDVARELSDSEYEQLLAQVRDIDAAVLSQLFDRFARVVDSLARTRVPRLVLEVGLLDLVHSDPLVPLGDLVSRLEQLAGGGSGVGDPSGSRRPGSFTPGGSHDLRSSPARGSSRSRNAPRRESTGAPSPGETAARLQRMMREHGAISPGTPSEGPDEDPGGATAASAGPRVRAQPPAATPEATTPSRPTVAPLDRSRPPYEVWEALLDRIRGEDRALFVLLAECGLARLDDAELHLAPHIARDRLVVGSPLRAELEVALERHLGGRRRLEFVDGEPTLPDLPSVALVHRERERKAREAVRLEAEAQPEIQRVLQDFEGRIARVDPLTPAHERR
ncbi:MAG: DNA polymerase III subunit gamma/tau [Nannocystaceae bacterium]|nr:DNA polymerase III subunit gamma/tau [Myxococcales bacterium]